MGYIDNKNGMLLPLYNHTKAKDEYGEELPPSQVEEVFLGQEVDPDCENYGEEEEK